MAWIYRRFARPFLFLADSETAHNGTLQALAAAARRRWALRAARACLGAPGLPVEAMGLRFPNPLGLAAGMDKHARALPMWGAMGFGFCELGGVTLHVQPGNPRPRMFRVVAEEALVNRMGFNNPGAEAMAAALADWRASGLWPDHPVGVNLGKSKTTELADAPKDYAGSMALLWPHADFFVVNVSSPNTPNLRSLQDRGALDALLAALAETNSRLAAARGAAPKPVLVKVAPFPDLSWEALDEVADLAVERGLAGMVAVNTTLQRPAAVSPAAARSLGETGGLSGRPLHARAVEVVRHLRRRTAGRLTLIGVGGVSSADDAWRMAAAGASLIQAYSALVYQGPRWPSSVVAELRRRLGGGRWEDLVGSEA